MKLHWQILIILCIAALTAGVYFAKEKDQPVLPSPDKANKTADAQTEQNPAQDQGDPQQLPAEHIAIFKDFGKGKCIQCVKMKDTIKTLRARYPGVLKVEYYDVSTPEGLREFKLEGGTMIPFQIFCDGTGEVIYQNEGFIKPDAVSDIFKDAAIDLDKEIAVRNPELAKKNAEIVSENKPAKTLFDLSFDWLNSNSSYAILGSLLWGIVSIICSPCHLSSIPLIVGYIGSGRKKTAGYVFGISLSFGGGMFVSILAIGVLLKLLDLIGFGSLMVEHSNIFYWVIAVLLMLVGLMMMNVLPVPFAGAVNAKVKSHGIIPAFIFGFIFGVALGPCSAGFMTPILLGVAFSRPAETAIAFALLVAFAVGHCGVIVAAGSSTHLVQRYVDWNNNSRVTTIVKACCGLLIIAAAQIIIYCVVS